MIQLYQFRPPAGMISNLRFIVGCKVESSCQQIIRAIFIFLTHSQQSTMIPVQPESILHPEFITKNG